MKSSVLFQICFLVILIAAPLIYLSASWERLPAQVPLHWGIDGKPNRMGSKHELLLTIVILLGAGLAAYLLLSNIDRIDPKKNVAISKPVMQKMSVAVLVFLSALSIFIIHKSVSQTAGMDKSLYILLGLFFAYLGNIMHSLKPNYFAGIRTPWTLESEENWRKTHQLASKIWVAGGALITLVALIFPMNITLIIFASALVIMSLYPILYSYSLFRQSKTA